MSEPKKLYRSLNERMLGGVCGGVGEYFNIDPTIVRIIWVFLIFMGGLGLFLYIVALFIVPLNPNSPPEKTPVRKQSPNMIIGLVMIILGILLLLGFRKWSCFPWFFPCSLMTIWPVVIIITGLALLIYPKKPHTSIKEGDYNPHRLYRLREGRLFLGVAGGAGDYFNIDRNLARLICILFFFISGGLGILAYLILYFILPEKPYVIDGGENDAQK